MNLWRRWKVRSLRRRLQLTERYLDNLRVEHQRVYLEYERMRIALKLLESEEEIAEQT